MSYSRGIRVSICHKVWDTGTVKRSVHVGKQNYPMVYITESKVNKKGSKSNRTFRKVN